MEFNPNKLNHRIIFSSIDHLLNHDNIFLIFIGEKPYPRYFELLSEQIKKNNLIKKIKILGFSEQKIFQNYLVAADIAIQLRENSRRNLWVSPNLPIIWYTNNHKCTWKH